MTEVLAKRIEEAAASWLPISGHVVNVTFSLSERDTIVAALRSSPPPIAGREEIARDPRCDCQQPEEIDGQRLISNSCPVHNENPDPPYPWPDDTPSPSAKAWDVAYRNSLVLIRNAVVLSLAFLGRDAGSSRSEHTTPQIIQMLANADAEVRRLLASPTTVSDASREALEKRKVEILALVDAHGLKHPDTAWHRAFGELAGINLALELFPSSSDTTSAAGKSGGGE